MAICGLWSPQFIVAEGHNIREITERLFMFKGFHGSLWSKATTVMRSQWRGLLSTLHPAAAAAAAAVQGYLK